MSPTPSSALPPSTFPSATKRVDTRRAVGGRRAHLVVHAAERERKGENTSSTTRTRTIIRTTQAERSEAPIVVYIVRGEFGRQKVSLYQHCWMLCITRSPSPSGPSSPSGLLQVDQHVTCHFWRFRSRYRVSQPSSARHRLRDQSWACLAPHPSHSIIAQRQSTQLPL